MNMSGYSSDIKNKLLPQQQLEQERQTVEEPKKGHCDWVSAHWDYLAKWQS